MKWLTEMFGWRSGLTRHQRGILSEVRRGKSTPHCWPPAYGRGPDLYYSIGWPQLVGQPEIIFFERDVEDGLHLFKTIYKRCQNGLALTDGVILDDVYSSGAVRFIVRDVAPEAIADDTRFDSARWYHDYALGHPIDRWVQIVRSSPKGLFPWDEGCPASVRRQPVLYAKRVEDRP